MFVLEAMKRLNNRIKRSGNRRWAISLLYRIIPLSLLAIVPAIIVFSALYGDVRSHYIQETMAGLEAETTFAKETLELTLNNIRSQGYEFWVDRDVLQLATGSSILDRIEVVERIRRVQSRLIAVKRSSDLIVDATMVFADGRQVIRTDGVDMVSEEEINAYRDKLDLHYRGQYFDDEGLHIIQSYPTILSDTSKARAILIIDIPSNKLREHLNQQRFSDTDVIYLANRSGMGMPNTLVGESVDPPFIAEAASSIAEATELGESVYAYEGDEYLMVAVYSSMLQNWLVKQTAFSEAFRMSAFTNDTIVLMISIIILVTAVSFMVLFYFLFRPLRNLYDAFDQLGQGEFGIHIDYRPQDSFAEIYRSFNEMSHELNALVSKVYGQRILTQKAEMKHLQAQINPHFLYNSLFMLKTLLQIRNYDLAIKALDQLAGYYRFLARDGRTEIPLSDEVEHARTYTEIQRLRNSGRVSIYFGDLPDEAADYMVPRLILQPLIENAFEHGFRDVEEDGVLAINFALHGEWLEIRIENNGAQITDEELQELNDYVVTEDQLEITGLQNILSRIKRYFGDDCSLTFSINNNEFLCVSMKFALLRSNEHEEIDGGDVK